MNIMKINMLSLNDKMAREKAANSAASMPVMTANQSGMNALTFLGLKNLMEDPQLGKELGVMKDDAEGTKDESAKSYVAPFSSNIAFKHNGNMISKGAKAMAGVMLASATAVPLFTSCEKNYYDMPPAENKTEVTVTINDTQTTALLNSMMAILAQMLEQQKISREDFNNYMAQIIAWQKGVSGDINDLKAILTSMADKIIDIDNGVQENNGYQKVIIALLEAQLGSHEKAVAILQEAIDWAKANNNDILGALAKIMEVLNKISSQIDQLSKQFGDAVDIFRNKLDSLTIIAKGIYNNDVTTNEKITQLYNEVQALKAEVINTKNTAIEIKNNLEKGIDVDTSKLEALLETLNINQQASTEEIIAKLNEFIKNQEKLEAAINKLDQNNQSKLDYVASLILNKTGDNSDVVEAINNLAKSNEDNLAAAVEALAAKLDALITKVDAVLNKMDDLSNLIKLYGDQILVKFEENAETLKGIKEDGDSLKILVKIQNMDIAELKAEFEKIKPEIVKLNQSATTANFYLEELTKKSVEFKTQMDSLIAIAGKALTKDELEELWVKHDADNYAKYKAFLDGLHAEDMDKADEIIALMKKGNATNEKIYNWLLDFAEKNDLTQEQLKALLEAIYKYLPELKCNCNCQGDCDDNTNHEGIIGGLLD